MKIPDCQSSVQIVEDFDNRLSVCVKDLLDNVKEWNYVQEIYHNLLDVDQPAQITAESALSVMFYKDLIHLGWHCDYSLIGWNHEKHYGTVAANEWLYSKNNKKILIIFGEGLTVKFDRAPDLIITDSIQFDFGASVFFMNPEIFGLHENIIGNDWVNHSPTKLFNCFMAAPSVTRQGWLYELTRQCMLDKGHVSYRLADRNEHSMDENLDLKLERFDQYGRASPNLVFEREHQWLRSKIPYCNFNTSQEQAIIDSKVSVVIETEYNESQQLFITEKTFRAMLMPRPFVIFCSGYCTGTIDYLRRLDFEVHDDIINHDYDLIPDPVPRLNHMIREINRLQNLQFDQSMLDRLTVRANKNQSLVEKFRKNLGQKYATAIELIKNIASDTIQQQR